MNKKEIKLAKQAIEEIKAGKGINTAAAKILKIPFETWLAYANSPKELQNKGNQLALEALEKILLTVK